MSIARGPGPRDCRIAVEGELDSATSPQLLRAFQEATVGSPSGEIVLDLSRLAFVDSTGLRALIEIEQDASGREISLVVVPAPDPVTELLQVSGVAARLRLIEDQPALPAEFDFLERADLELPGVPQAPSLARATVRELLAGVLDAPRLASAVLMTSELVTNAVIHSSADATSTVGLHVVVYPEFARIEVDDAGAGFDPTEHLVAAGDIPGPGQGGRGLFVVDRSSSRWGIRRHETDRGTRFSVWFEIGT